MSFLYEIFILTVPYLCYKFGLMRKGEYIGVSVVLNMHTKFCNLEDRNNSDHIEKNKETTSVSAKASRMLI